MAKSVPPELREYKGEFDFLHKMPSNTVLGIIPISTIRNRIPSPPRLFVDAAIRYSQGRADGAAGDLTARYGSAVNAIRSRECLAAEIAMWRKSTLEKAYVMAWNAILENR